MSIVTTFKVSLSLPKKKAVYQINRIKTKDYLLYILLMHFVIALPNGIQMASEFIAKGDIDKTFLLVFTLYPLLVILTGITSISVLATTGLLIRTVAKRKLIYQLLWKMAMYACTYPVLLYTTINLFYKTNSMVHLILVMLFLYIFTKMILAYPKKKR
ncbi:DUF1189 family protein [Viridibacillus arvi]|uniref:DUF1189 family protein n=1 Tax=Viridibacillus arvi TaxID=263475 RepID=UPI003D2E7947